MTTLEPEGCETIHASMESTIGSLDQVQANNLSRIKDYQQEQRNHSENNSSCQHSIPIDLGDHTGTLTLDGSGITPLPEDGNNLPSYFETDTNRDAFLSTVFLILGLQFVFIAAIVVGTHDLHGFHIFDPDYRTELGWLTGGVGVFSLVLMLLMFFHLDWMKRVNFKLFHLEHVVLGLFTLGGAFVASALQVIGFRDYYGLETYYVFFAMLITGLSFMSMSLFYWQTKLEKSFINLGMLIISNNSGFGIVCYIITFRYTLPICVGAIIGIVLTTYVQILCIEIMFPRGCLNPTVPSNDVVLAVVYVYMGIVFVGFVIYSFLMCICGCPSKVACCWGKCFCHDGQPKSQSNSV